jgi:hypothetical protein
MLWTNSPVGWADASQPINSVCRDVCPTVERRYRNVFGSSSKVESAMTTGATHRVR